MRVINARVERAIGKVREPPDFPVPRWRFLRDAPGVRRAAAARYPIIFVDEHQDSSRVQHDIITSIALQAGVHLRMFGDRLQSIYAFGADEVAGWEPLAAHYGALALDTPQRWPQTPALGAWLIEARRALLEERPIPLHNRPPEVVVHHWAGTAPGPGQQGFVPECAAYLRRLNSCAILVRNRDHAVGLATLVGRTPVYEGPDSHVAGSFLEEAEAAAGNPRALVVALIKVMGLCGSGLPQSVQKQVEEACLQAGIEFGKKVKLRPLLELCESLYREPTLHTWLATLRSCFEQRQALGWSPYRYDPLLTLIDRRLRDAESPVDALPALSRRRGETPWVSKRFVATIHKVKGREFEEVAIPYCSSSSFPGTPEGRRLLYVAMTRARTRLHLLIPNGNCTPLLAA